MATNTTTGNSHAAAAQRGPPGPFQYAAMVANNKLAESQASQRNQTKRGRVDDTGGLYGYFALLVFMALLYATRYGSGAIARWYSDAPSSPHHHSQCAVWLWNTSQQLASQGAPSMQGATITGDGFMNRT
jgi:hypothetical protein